MKIVVTYSELSESDKQRYANEVTRKMLQIAREFKAEKEVDKK